MNRHLLIALLSALLAGCAAGPPAAPYFTLKEEPSRPGKLQFHIQGGALSTVRVFRNSFDCSGLETIVFYAPGTDTTVYGPLDKYVSFSIYVQAAAKGAALFKASNAIYTVPFQSGDLRVTTSFDDKEVTTRIESRDETGWHPAQGVVRRRQFGAPLAMFGSLCYEDEAFKVDAAH